MISSRVQNAKDDYSISNDLVKYLVRKTSQKHPPKRTVVKLLAFRVRPQHLHRCREFIQKFAPKPVRFLVVPSGCFREIFPRHRADKNNPAHRPARSCASTWLHNSPVF